ncbi:hypothetical protein DPMN_082482 [Dreissena polymorpha]|uniref:Uncharacterized protein n=1 Tax=Dreissena polymorpha TaxID=45954 RepID=A0A9D4BHI2_DREPO|nr:hypothetical protein DPMN_082482 [Dreissena polymorpha]
MSIVTTMVNMMKCIKNRGLSLDVKIHEVCLTSLLGLKSDNNNNEAVASSSRFDSLSKKFRTVETCDQDVDPVLANNVNELFRQGMEEGQYNQLTKDEINARPSNCDGLVVVNLNLLVWDIVSPVARSRDKKLQTLETSIVKSASVLVKTVDKAAKMESQAKQSGSDIGPLIDGCYDALALRGHANRVESSSKGPVKA